VSDDKKDLEGWDYRQIWDKIWCIIKKNHKEG